LRHSPKFVDTLMRIIAVLLLTVATAAAQSPEPSPSPAPSPPSWHVENFGDSHATCLRWSDGCRTCVRGSAGEPICANIGIACQPTEVKCLEQSGQGEQK
jgi:hypothetical protein